MEAYAVIETGGKQYRVGEGQIIDIERLEGEAGQKITLDRVLALSDGNQLQIGAPALDGAAISAEIIEQFRGDKVVSFKKKRRKGYKKKIGHRQHLTRIKVLALSGETKSNEKASAKTAETAEV